ncbi:MAG TPA: efflux RND transporter periplasmic adaptor subunit [Candidatus Polarisedimenticolaceae bacterium]|nr:efflux RND transporter periplasmic adaptor subunit [Candidatus Polarisedimenticolaceae bacterium]
MVPTVPIRRRKRWPWILVVVLVIAGSAGFFGMRYGGGSGAGSGIKVDDLDLRIGRSAVQDVQVTVTEAGTIEPVVKVDVKSTLSGKVIDLLVREGDKVAAGQVLARVEPDVNQAQTLAAVRSEMKLAEIQAGDAQRDLETNERLFREGYVSDTDMKRVRVRFDTSLEGLEAAKTKYQIVEESGIPLGVEISTSQRVNIVAPMAGSVIHKNVEVGQTVTSGLSSFNEGTILYTVADLKSMLIKASINEVDIGRVRLEMPVAITVDAFPYRHFDGKVTHISPAARLKDKVKVFDIEVTLAEQVPEFRAGMTANVEIRGDKVAQVLTIPSEAVFKQNDREVVYLLKHAFDEPKEGERKPRKLKSGKYDVSDVWQRFFEERQVKVGLASLERAQILQGLDLGVDVALENPTRPRQIAEED